MVIKILGIILIAIGGLILLMNEFNDFLCLLNQVVGDKFSYRNWKSTGKFIVCVGIFLSIISLFI